MNGIYIQATIGGGFWSDTKDPIYLGVYGKNGGREFALQVNGESPFTSDGATVNLILGQPCCNKTGLQVDNSLNSKENDPELNPLGVNDIEYVYLRKYNGETGTTDDWTEFSSVSVLFCDSSGNLLRFKKSGRIHMAKEAGLQHWLIKDPTAPKCVVTIKLKNIHHIPIADNPAGHRWHLSWHMLVPESVSPSSGVDSLILNVNPSSSNEEWNEVLNRSYSYEVEGCCRKSPVIISCVSSQREPHKPGFGIHIPHVHIGVSTGSTVLQCSVPDNADSFQVETDVRSDNGKSRLTYFFDVEMECFD